MEEIKKQLSLLENKLATFSASLPHLPEEWKKMLISAMPWLAIIFGVLMVFSVFGLIQVWNAYHAMVNVYGVNVNLSSSVGVWWWVLIITDIALAVFYFMAYPGLVRNQKKGWNNLYYAEVIGVVGYLLSVIFGGGSLFGLVGALIGVYLLFEIRSHYTR